MKRKEYLLLVCALITAWLRAAAVRAEPLEIVTTLSSYADIARAVGGDLVEASSVASPRFNPHFIEPRPSDVLKVKRCDLFVHSGLDLESWRAPLLNAAANPEIRAGGRRQLDLSVGVELLEVPDSQPSRAQGDIHLSGNPHYWLDPRNGKLIATAIARKLAELDPGNSEAYARGERELHGRIDAKLPEWQRLIVPFRGARLVGYHNEWVYLMSFLGLEMSEFLEEKPGVPPSAKHIEHLVEYSRANGVRAIVQSSFYPREASDSVAARAGARVAVLAQNVGELEEARSYVEMIDFDVKELVEALSHD